MSKKTSEAPVEQAQIAGPGDTSNQPTTIALKDQLAQQFAEDAGSGLEDFSGDNFAIPFLVILQKNSPQVDEANASYIVGAKAGMFYNTVTGKLYDHRVLPNQPAPQGLRIIPVKFKQVFVEWVPRDNGGGFVGEHLPESDVHLSATPDKDKPMRLNLANGNQLVETFKYYILIVDNDGGAEWALFAATSTQLTPCKKMNTIIGSRKIKLGNGKQVNAPIFAQQFDFNTVTNQNDYGTWSGLKVTQVEDFVSDPNLYAGAKAYREAIEGGNVKESAPVPEGGSDVGATAGAAQGDVPF